jgi:hypothetical protein
VAAPEIGDIVLFRHGSGEDYPAIVTVVEGETVSLQVFGPLEVFSARLVPEDTIRDAEVPVNTWRRRADDR